MASVEGLHLGCADGPSEPIATDSFPRQKARTRNFTLGEPRSFHVAADGSRITFLRSPAGDDARNALWVFEVEAGRERLVADPADLAGGGSDEDLSAEERARRERVRETASGIVSYATDRDARVAALVQSGDCSSPTSSVDSRASWTSRPPCSTPDPTRPGVTSRSCTSAGCTSSRSTTGL